MELDLLSGFQSVFNFGDGFPESLCRPEGCEKWVTNVPMNDVWDIVVPSRGVGFVAHGLAIAVLPRRGNSLVRNGKGNLHQHGY